VIQPYPGETLLQSAARLLAHAEAVRETHPAGAARLQEKATAFIEEAHRQHGRALKVEAARRKRQARSRRRWPAGLV
jgi:hypothetical protein